jgi:hypothetical protein
MFLRAPSKSRESLMPQLSCRSFRVEVAAFPRYISKVSSNPKPSSHLLHTSPISMTPSTSPPTWNALRLYRFLLSCVSFSSQSLLKFPRNFFLIPQYFCSREFQKGSQKILSRWRVMETWSFSNPLASFPRMSWNSFRWGLSEEAGGKMLWDEEKTSHT